MEKRIRTSIIIAYIIIIYIICLAIPALAQTDNKEKEAGSLGTEQVNVVQDYKPTVIDAVKLNDNPTINDSTPLNPKLTYTFLNKKFNQNFELEPISAAKMKGEPLNKLYKSYVKIGLGNYSTPYAELFINNLRSKEYSIGTHFKHFSSAFKSKNLGYAGFSDDDAGVFGKYFLKDNTISAALDYNRNAVHYYGVDRLYSDTILDKSLTKQAYTNIGANINLLSQYHDSSKFNYEANIKFYNFSERGPATENNFFVAATLSKFVKTELFGGTISVDYYANKNSVTTFNDALISLAPFVKAAQQKWQATLGIKVTIESAEGRTHFFPNLHAKYNLIENILSAYLDIEGNTTRNSYKRLATENPFILSSLPLQNSNTPIAATLGVRGNISSEISFHIAGDYRSVKDLPLYVNYAQNTEQSRYTVIYDNANIANVHGELAYEKSDKFRLGGKIDYYQYFMENEEHAWHRPSLQLAISGKYNLQNKIWITADVFTINKQYAKISTIKKVVPTLVTESTTRELKGITDVNLGVEYLYNKRLSGFVRFNNIAAFRYYRYNNYPTQRFNLLAGITYSF